MYMICGDDISLQVSVFYALVALADVSTTLENLLPYCEVNALMINSSKWKVALFPLRINVLTTMY